MCELVPVGSSQEKNLNWLRRQKHLKLRTQEKCVRVENIHSSWGVQILKGNGGDKKILRKGRTHNVSPGSRVIIEGRQFVVRE